jgi:hypothetical protein
MTDKELRIAQLYTRLAKLNTDPIMNAAIINKIKRNIRKLERTS